MTTTRKTAPITDQVREVIASRKLSSYAVAKAAEIDDSIVARFMAGTHTPSGESLDAIAAVLGLRVIAGGGGMRKSPKRAKRSPNKAKAKPSTN